MEDPLSRSGKWGAAVAGAKAVMAMSRIQKLHAEKQAVVEEVMEAFGDAVSNAAPEAEVQRLNARLERAQEEARRVAELKESVDEKQALAEKCLESFGEAVNSMQDETVVRRLSDQWEEAQRAAEKEEDEKLRALARENEMADALDRARKQAERHEQKMLRESQKKDSAVCAAARRASFSVGGTTKRTDSGGVPDRRRSADRGSGSNVKRADSLSNANDRRRTSLNNNKSAVSPERRNSSSYGTKGGDDNAKKSPAAPNNNKTNHKATAKAAVSTAGTRAKANAGVPLPLPR